ncbi:MAG: glycosyltransferase [Blastocatellia bacterium]|nr:glycosyltransferase [Blastocatellia bacterium]
MLASKGDIVLFSDADLSAPIEELPKLVDPIRAGEVDIAIGSRALDRSLVGVHQSAAREVAGRLFNLLMRGLTGMPFRDTQCGFKAFRAEASRDVFGRVLIERFGFDVEALFVARKLGYSVREVPVVWNNVEGSTVGLMSGLNGYADVLRVRFNDLRGRYGKRRAARAVNTD